MKTVIALAAGLGMAATVQAQQPVPSLQASAPESVTLTIYPVDLALVREQRSARLPGGQTRLQIGAIPSQLRPETVMLQANDPASLRLLEIAHDPGRLSAQALLEQHVGREVGVRRGQASAASRAGTAIERAVLLSAQGGVLLQFPDRIETATADSIVFDRLPAGLNARPALDALIESEPGERSLQLSYQSGGLSWKTDYVAQLSADARSLDLSGWATIDNRSGADFPAARLQLVAGKIQRAPELHPAGQPLARAMVMSAPATPTTETLLDYHLYRFEQPVTLRDQQTLQLALLPGQRIPVRRAYLLSGHEPLDPGRQQDGIQQLRPAVMLEFVNPGGPDGKPLPAGTIRVHSPDQQGALQLVGEDQIPPTAAGETARLRLGSAFDLSAERRQTAYRKLGDSSSESRWQVKLRNAGARPATVKLQENLPGDWTLLQSSHPGQQESAHLMSWTLDVPAGGSVQLDYTVRQRW